MGVIGSGSKNHVSNRCSFIFLVSFGFSRMEQGRRFASGESVGCCFRSSPRQRRKVTKQEGGGCIEMGRAYLLNC